MKKKQRKKKAADRGEPTLRDVQLALLDLFSVVDAVFTEDDALTPQSIHKTTGRIYETWKRCRATLDTSFDPKLHDQALSYGTKRMSGFGTTWPHDAME